MWQTWFVQLKNERSCGQEHECYIYTNTKAPAVNRMFFETQPEKHLRSGGRSRETTRKTSGA